MNALWRQIALSSLRVAVVLVASVENDVAFTKLVADLLEHRVGWCAVRDAEHEQFALLAEGLHKLVDVVEAFHVGLDRVLCFAHLDCFVDIFRVNVP